MQKLLLTELIHNLEQKLLQLGYSQSSMRFFCRHWRALLQFAQEREELFYSEQLGPGHRNNESFTWPAMKAGYITSESQT